MIKSGRYGQVLYDPLGVTPVAVVSLNNWKLSSKTEKSEVTCFGDPNKVYVPGLPDFNGSLSGFWNSAGSDVLFDGALAETPGLLKLVPNTTEPTFFWSGLAYLDAEIDTAVAGAPAIAGEWMAAGAWTREPEALARKAA